MSTNDCKYFVLFSNEVFACLILIRHLMMLMMYLLFLNIYPPTALFLPLSNSTNFILLTFICLLFYFCLLAGSITMTAAMKLLLLVVFTFHYFQEIFSCTSSTTSLHYPVFRISFFFICFIRRLKRQKFKKEQEKQ